MGITDVFSKRHKTLPDVFTYDSLPKRLRAQIMHILEDAAGSELADCDGWPRIARAIVREHGLVEFPGKISRHGEADYYKLCLRVVLEGDSSLVLDLIELAMQQIEALRDNRWHMSTVSMSADEAISELNHRFAENGIGYQFISGQIVRVDSQLLHSEVVKPALALLTAKGFEGPNKEFLEAHEHFRHGRVEAAITDACKAFESTMKAICDARQWPYDGNTATANALIKVIISNGLVPNYSEEQFRSMEKCLIGVATVRNKNSGHGGGAKPRDLPEYLAAYALHLAAANIVFLIESHRAT